MMMLKLNNLLVCKMYSLNSNCNSQLLRHTQFLKIWKKIRHTFFLRGMISTEGCVNRNETKERQKREENPMTRGTHREKETLYCKNLLA